MLPRGLRSATTTLTNSAAAANTTKGLTGYPRGYATMADRVHRVTMFKMPKAEDQQRMLEQYRKMAADNQRNGKPYILSMSVGPAEDDPRTQGYTLVSKTEFASMDDMKFYDEECPAHGAVKSFIKQLTVEGILTVYFKAQASGGTDQQR